MLNYGLLGTLAIQIHHSALGTFPEAELRFGVRSSHQAEPVYIISRLLFIFAFIEIHIRASRLVVV